MQPSPVDIGGYWNMYHANAGGIGEKDTIQESEISFAVPWADISALVS